MKKVLSVIMVLLLLATLFSGCKKQTPIADAIIPSKDSDSSSEDTDDTEDTDDASTGNKVADSYSAYLEAKNNVITKISDGLSSNEEAGMAVLSFLGISMADLALLPVSFFGMGQDTMMSGLAFMGALDVKYTENGNDYSVTYSNAEKEEMTFKGTYDPAADSLTSSVSTDGAESIFSEYHKTSYGYVGQYYFLNDDGTATTYVIAVDGDDGTIGISTETAKPAALTGKEAADFPKDYDEWYSIKGDTITGVTSSGTELNFKYEAPKN